MTSSPPVLAIGPSNYAGQADAWCRAVSDSLPASAWSFARAPVRGRGFGFPADVRIPLASYYLPLARRARFRYLFRATTHVALDGFQPFYAWYGHGDAPKDARWLGRRGWETALIAHGSDVRDPVAHLERHEHSMFATGDAQWRQALATVASRNREAAVASGLPLFVSTPDLLSDLPSATWLPLCIDASAWATQVPAMEASVPVVLHLPSRREPPIKGTQFVDPVCRDLERRGAITYLSPEHVLHAQMPALVARADIVIDQLLASSYGVTAVEAMAAGRVVIAGVGDATRASMPEDPPLVDADPVNLADVLVRLIDDRDQARAKAAAGSSYVGRWHSGPAAADRLRSFLGLA